MPENRESVTEAGNPPVIPVGNLVKLLTSEIVPSENNPRHLFDPEPLETLKRSIRQHGVLVPITVYQKAGQTKYFILDGQRRFTCCKQLQEEENRELSIPANVVEPPSKTAALIYMFSIHNFREQWELMPTALALETLIDTLNEADNLILSKLTGLSDPQIKRCRILLTFPKKFQALSLEPDPKTRIPSNFWIEAFPVLNLCDIQLPELVERLGRDGITDKLVEKYNAKPRRIKSVIHFRRIMEAFDNAPDENESAKVVEALKEFIEDVELETRATFDSFLVNNRRVLGAISACDDLIKNLQRSKLDYTLDRNELRDALTQVKEYVTDLLIKLEGTDAPSVDEEVEGE